MEKVLVSGGAGFIGTHTVVELIESGFEVLIVDNFDNSSPAVLEPLEKICGQKISLVEMDLCDREKTFNLFRENKIDSVIHFAGLKAVGESNQIPVRYYRNNIDSTLNLLDAMKENDCAKMVFSSSATVYGDPETVPILENAKLQATNPYGRTKLFIEEILRDTAKSDEFWNFVLLRYFNPVGAHPSGLIGEDPQGIPNNLMPYVARVATGQLEKLGVFGDDYSTPDGTGVRDYIHVVDLAKAHVASLKWMFGKKGCEVFNVGTGNGFSVLDMVKAFGKACGKDVPYEIKPRREGDIATCYAESAKLKEATGWQAEFGIEDMCEHLWKFMQARQA